MKEKNIIVLKNQGFCFGVKSAIDLLEENINKLPKPIYLLGNIVHNKFVKKHFEDLGVIVLENDTRINMLNNINSGSVVITAHGVSSSIYRLLEEKKIPYLDTTCPFVKKSSELILEYVNNGYDVVYIGKKKHPETEGIISESNHIHLIENINDLNLLHINNSKIALSNQTTMSIYDIEEIVNKIKEIYPNIVVLKTICNTTKNRQKELSETLNNLNGDNTLVFVIGDPTSNNTKMLEKRANGFKNALVFKIEDESMLDANLVKKYSNIVITSGASTPSYIVDKVIDKINNI